MMNVCLAWCWHGYANEISLEVIEGASLAELLVRVKNDEQYSHPSLTNALEMRAAIGVWGKVIHESEQAKLLLRNNDRVEIYQPLKADPKLARRQRADRKKFTSK